VIVECGSLRIRRKPTRGLVGSTLRLRARAHNLHCNNSNTFGYDNCSKIFTMSLHNHHHAVPNGTSLAETDPPVTLPSSSSSSSNSCSSNQKPNMVSFAELFSFARTTKCRACLVGSAIFAAITGTIVPGTLCFGACRNNARAYICVSRG
jgi:hypothetical protein